MAPSAAPHGATTPIKPNIPLLTQGDWLLEICLIPTFELPSMDVPGARGKPITVG